MDAIDINKAIRAGQPVLHGTRVPIAQILAELIDDVTVTELVDALELDRAMIDKMLAGLPYYVCEVERLQEEKQTLRDDQQWMHTLIGELCKLFPNTSPAQLLTTIKDLRAAYHSS